MKGKPEGMPSFDDLDPLPTTPAMGDGGRTVESRDGSRLEA